MSLIEILMSKEPSYVRCIKPNENKEPGKALGWVHCWSNGMKRCRVIVGLISSISLPIDGYVSELSHTVFISECVVFTVGKFDDCLIRHQVKYLGLMEHLRVRRAGFAYRRKYEHFLQRWADLLSCTARICLPLGHQSKVYLYVSVNKVLRHWAFPLHQA